MKGASKKETLTNIYDPQKTPKVNTSFGENTIKFEQSEMRDIGLFWGKDSDTIIKSMCNYAGCVADSSRSGLVWWEHVCVCTCLKTLFVGIVVWAQNRWYQFGFLSENTGIQRTGRAAFERADKTVQHTFQPLPERNVKLWRRAQLDMVRMVGGRSGWYGTVQHGQKEIAFLILLFLLSSVTYSRSYIMFLGLCLGVFHICAILKFKPTCEFAC